MPFGLCCASFSAVNFINPNHYLLSLCIFILELFMWIAAIVVYQITDWCTTCFDKIIFPMVHFSIFHKPRIPKVIFKIFCPDPCCPTNSPPPQACIIALQNVFAISAAINFSDIDLSPTKVCDIFLPLNSWTSESNLFHLYISYILDRLCRWVRFKPSSTLSLDIWFWLIFPDLLIHMNPRRVHVLLYQNWE